MCSGQWLFRSLEFAPDKVTKACFPVALPVALLLDDAIFLRGVAVCSGSGKGTVDGVKGDHILLSPPLTISKEEADIAIKAVADGVEEVLASDRVKTAMPESILQWLLQV